MFGKPVSQLTLADIQALVDNSEKESLILEYKQEISGADRERKEIAKDVSAIANTDGGYLVVGIEEEDRRPIAIVGTPRRIGRQPVEEWIESILIANVRPKLTITPKVINLAANSDRVIVVIYIPKSSRRPHMVAINSRNAYYKRHNYQALYADEYEVRSMALESKSLGDEMRLFLDSRNLNDTLNNFAITPLSNLLAKTLEQIRELPEGFIGKPVILFAACPRYLEERIDVASSDFRDWLNAYEKVGLLGLDIDFLSYEKEISADSLRSIEEFPISTDGVRPLRRYTEIFRNGYVESGVGPEIMWPHSKLGLMFNISWFTASFWQFIKFCRALYERIGYIDEVSLLVALADIENITLHGFGKKDEKTNWLDPYNFRYSSKMPICKQKNVRIERNIIASELSDPNIEGIVKDISKRVSNAFGESIAKCFDDQGNFDREQLHGFRNVH